MHVDAAERADRNRSRALARLVAGPSMHDKIPAVWSIRDVPILQPTTTHALDGCFCLPFLLSIYGRETAGSK